MVCPPKSPPQTHMLRPTTDFYFSPTMNLIFNHNGLIPVIVQNITSGKVLMLAYANEEALTKTKETGFAHFYSRSRKKLWRKGEESGNTLKMKGIKSDCDQDAILYLVEPTGNTCHTGEESCFFRGDSQTTDVEFVCELEKIIEHRQKQGDETSYVHSLFTEGLDRIAQKVGEEAVETVISAKNDDDEDFLNESADLLLHLLILLRARKKSLIDIVTVLKERH